MATRKLSEFGQAFADARTRGEKEFTFKGKKYHTRTADEEEQPSMPVAGGKPKPGEYVRRDFKQRMDEIDRETAGEATAAKYKPRRSEYTLSDATRPGTRVTYDNPEADMPTFAKGGSASSRADGIAKRGRTRGKVC